MKKKAQVYFSLVILILMGFAFWLSKEKQVEIRVCESSAPVLSVKTGVRYKIIYPWLDDTADIYYYFLPAFVDETKFFLDNTTGDDLLVNGERAQNGSFNWQEGECYEYRIKDEAYKIVFMQSANLPAVFIETASESMERINLDKEYEEAGNITVTLANGMVEYYGQVEKISGRGNSTWEYDKKPYALTLRESESLCGLRKGKRWALLAACRESDKMRSRLTFDIADELGLSFSPEAVWIDLYLNGEYAGIYYLCENISVGSGRVDIYDLEKENETGNPDMKQVPAFEEENRKGYELEHVLNVSGGYLIEKDLEDRYDLEKSGFITDKGYRFAVKSPAHASREQIAYIRDYVQNIENLLEMRDVRYRDYIDMDSFAKCFLVDELSLQIDANITSAYFYKDRTGVLYAGPVWDYDSAWGGDNHRLLEGNYVDYEWTTLTPRMVSRKVLDWNVILYEDEVFYRQVTDAYEELLPYMEQILMEKAGEYEKYIEKSVKMDAARWPQYSKMGRYKEYHNNVRYLQYFISQRLNYLNARWQVTDEKYIFEGNGEIHRVVFVMGDEVIKTENYKDGQEIKELPFLDSGRYAGWRSDVTGEIWTPKLPVLEDMVLYAKELEDKKVVMY